MNYRLTALILFLLSTQVMSQETWINYSLDYFKIPTDRDGVYSLDYATLSAAGINMNQIDPRDIRLYHRGKEIAVHVEGQNDGRFDRGDYLEFIGKRNDGTLDSLLYMQPEMMPNPYYNTHNDSTAYFLTITPGQRGRRMPIKEPYPMTVPAVTSYEVDFLDIYSDQYSLGEIYELGARLSNFDRGQGWMGPVITRGSHKDYLITDLGEVVSSDRAGITLGLVGRSADAHLIEISVGPSPSRLRSLGRYSFPNFDFLKLQEALFFSDFGPRGDLMVRIFPLGAEGMVDNVSLSYMKVNYSKQLGVGDFKKERFNLSKGEARLVITGLYKDYLGYDLTDFQAPVKLMIQRNGNSIDIPAGNPSRPSKILVQQVSDVVKVTLMEKVRFRNILQQSADYIIISNKLLRRPSSSYADAVTAYAAYRASPSGGGFDTLTVNVQDLYNQFSYGEKTPLAIFEFLKKYTEKYQPDFLLLIGRSYGIYNTRKVAGVNHTFRNNPSVFGVQDLLPPAGYPYSDNLYATGLDHENQTLAVGRIPARTPDEVGYYLDKIKEKDLLGVQEDWQKNIVHLSGGRSALELEKFFSFLSGFKAVAEDVYLGGRVTTIRKRAKEVVEMINISEEVNAGLSLVTFFGHSAPAATDIDIGFVSVNELGYNNKGKYPVLLLNGCDAGNAFGDAYTFGEDWILTPEKGASNYMAHSSLGVDSYLKRYSDSFYVKAFSDSTLIYQSIGKVKIEAEKLLYSRYGTAPIYQSHVQQMIMLGDPAARIFPASKADYSIREEDVFVEGFEGMPMNTLSDSLKLSFIIRNIGRVDQDSVSLKVTRSLPDGTVIPYDLIMIPPVYRRDTLSFTVPNIGVNSFGENFYTIELNREKRIDELNFSNNVVTIGKYLQLSGTMNLAPVDFGLLRDRQIELISQIPGGSTEDRTVVVQIDSVADFSSPGRKENRFTTSNLVQWPLDLFQSFSPADSLTLYWRSRFLEPREGEDSSWNLSSFSYINQGPDGWTQRQFPQFDNNQLDNLEVNPLKQSWKYKDIKMDVEVFTFGSDNPDYNFKQTQIMLNGISYILDTPSRYCAEGSLGLMAFDQKTLMPYLPVPLTAIDVSDEKSCGRTPQIIQNIKNVRITGDGETLLLDFVDGLKDGDYVVVFSVGRVTFSDWSEEVYAKMRNLGANEATLRTLRTGDPYILFGKKGLQAGEAIEVVADKDQGNQPNTQTLRYSRELNGYSTSGRIISPRIGPASHWVSFFNEVQGQKLFDAEFSAFDVMGITPDGEELPLFESVQEDEIALESIDPNLFPYLKLQFAVNDPKASVPEQLLKWQVSYVGVPEGVLVSRNKQTNLKLKEGEEAEVRFEFINISKFDFPDSLTIEWTYSNKAQGRSENFSQTIPAIKAGQSHEFLIDFNSLGRVGKTSLHVFANPKIYQEQTFRNNVIDLPDYFIVEGDTQHPVLEVSFDGVYIMDGDIVSPTVLISSFLKDDNKLALKKDTTGMEVHFKKDCKGCEFERVSFSGIQMKWFEATEDRDFKLEFQPGPLEDGLYRVRINGADVAGNVAGEKPYEISFEVINESRITNFFPYPNPFSSKVQFVFTVTGSEVPDQIKIQILTVTGKVVREIFQEELGVIRIGNNITEYAWDGKDEYGDQLANGVYIYRILVRKNGHYLEHRPTAGDKAFKKGYGKMYLLR